MNAISIEGLRKSYGKFVAVDGLSLEIPQGSVFGLLGPNGAGKSTTFKCMLGLASPDSGTIRFNGEQLAPEVYEDVAYVPERSVLYEWMTVAQHVEMTRRAYKNFDATVAAQLLQSFNIDPRKKARALSKGMRTAAMVSLAFARRADVLILDEPTSGLDPINQRHVLNLIINEAARGATIVFSSHQIGQVERAAETIAVIDRGRLALSGSVDELKADRKIVEGVFPDDTYATAQFANDARIARIDKNGRILRLLVTSDAQEVGARLEALGAAGVRALDLNLEDIFLYAVSPDEVESDAVVVPTRVEV